MWRRYRSLCLLLCAAVMLPQPPLPADSPPPPGAWTDPRDAESRLAAGQRIDLCRAGVYELERIPGISDTLAFGILKQKRRILHAAAALPAERRREALLLVKGIGKARARKFGMYLSLICRRARRRLPGRLRL